MRLIDADALRRVMTKEKIKAFAFETIADIVGNPFEYCGDRSTEGDAMAVMKVGVVYGIVLLADSLCLMKGADDETD